MNELNCTMCHMELQYLCFSCAGLGELTAQCNPRAGKDLVQTVLPAGLFATVPLQSLNSRLLQWAWVKHNFAIKTNKCIWFEPSTEHLAY